MSDEPPLEPMPLRCELKHRVFSTFGDLHFRRSEADGAPVLTMRLGEREAQVPLEALRKEFGIAEDSADGRMLALIAKALEYVSCLQPGDRLPPEVLDGQASWRPSPNHLRLAATRLRLNLVAWSAPKSRWAGAQRDELSLLRLADDPALSREVQAAALAAAHMLGLRDGEQVLRLMEELSEELSYIEALRQRLLTRVEQLCRRVARLLHSRQGGPSPDTLSQVHRLGVLAFRQFRSRFDDVDALTGVFETLKHDLDGIRGFIRTTRDFLYRSQRAWEPLLAKWDKAADEAAGGAAGLLSATYQFLAPRFMPFTEWQGQKRAAAAPPRTQAASAGPGAAQMAW